jgi:hypothetical protein
MLLKRAIEMKIEEEITTLIDHQEMITEVKETTEDIQ